jgi:hypothetical protein
VLLPLFLYAVYIAVIFLGGLAFVMVATRLATRIVLDEIDRHAGRR